MSTPRHLTLFDLPVSPVCFSNYDEFLALTEQEMLRVVKAVARAGISDLKRLFGGFFPNMKSADHYGARMVARRLLAVGSGVARVTQSGHMEFDICMNELETFSNVLVQNKVKDALPIINKVTSDLMAELKSVVGGAG